MQRHTNPSSLGNVKTQGPTSPSFDQKYLNTLWAIDQLGRVPDCFGISIEACLIQFSQADGQLFDRSIQILDEIDTRLAVLASFQSEANLGWPDLELLDLRHKVGEIREWQSYHNRSNLAFWEGLRASTMKWVGPQRYLHECAKEGVKFLTRWKIPSTCPDQPPRSSNSAYSTYSKKRPKKSVRWDISSGVGAAHMDQPSPGSHRIDLSGQNSVNVGDEFYYGKNKSDDEIQATSQYMCASRGWHTYTEKSRNSLRDSWVGGEV